MPFLSLQQCQSTEGNSKKLIQTGENHPQWPHPFLIPTEGRAATQFTPALRSAVSVNRLCRHTNLSSQIFENSSTVDSCRRTNTAMACSSCLQMSMNTSNRKLHKPHHTVHSQYALESSFFLHHHSCSHN